MIVHLELEPTEHAHYATVRSGIAGPYRLLLIHVNGRPFSVWYSLSGYREHDENYLRNVDKMLARQFEQMLGRLFNVVASIVPVGLDLARATEAEIRDALSKVSAEVVVVEADHANCP